MQCHLWFSGETWAAISCEKLSDAFELVVSVFAIEKSIFTVRQNCDEQTIIICVVQFSD